MVKEESGYAMQSVRSVYEGLGGRRARARAGSRSWSMRAVNQSIISFIHSSTSSVVQTLNVIVQTSIAHAQSMTNALSAPNPTHSAVPKPLGPEARAPLAAPAPRAVPGPVPEVVVELEGGAVDVLDGALSVELSVAAPCVVTDPSNEDVDSPPVIVVPVKGGEGGFVSVPEEGVAGVVVVALVVVLLDVKEDEEDEDPPGAEIRVMENAGLVLPESPNTEKRMPVSHVVGLFGNIINWTYRR